MEMAAAVKLVTFRDVIASRVGVLQEKSVLDLKPLLETSQREISAASLQWADNMLALIEAGPEALRTVHQIIERLPPPAIGNWCLPIESVSLLAPIPRPRKNIFGVGLNYREHVREGAAIRGRSPEPPAHPTFFTRPPTAVIGPDAPIPLYEKLTRELDYELELGVIIGRKGIDIPEDRAMSYVFGYTVINDVSARDLQRRHGQWFKGKSLDATCPIGPCIVPAKDIRDAQDLDLTLRLNGQVMQSSNTRCMVFTIAALISILSQGMTLEPGDIIATGTPGGVGFARQPPVFLKDGDSIEAEIAGVGTLRNRVVASVSTG